VEVVMPSLHGTGPGELYKSLFKKQLISH